MKKQATLVIFIFLSLSIFSQTVEELEYELSVFTSGETYADKINYARQLLQKDPFNYRAIDFTLRYYKENKIDSISLFFDNLIKKYPDKVEPLILRAELLHFEYGFNDKINYLKSRIEYLNSALNIDKNDINVLFLMSETYYKDFIYPLEKPDYSFFYDFDKGEIDSTLIPKEEKVKRSVYLYSADSALVYFYRLWQIDTEIRDIIYYPIRQLECYLNRTSTSPIPTDAEQDFDQCYFPPWYFANLSQNWQCDFTIDYLFKIEMSKKYSCNWLKLQLSDLNEPGIYSNNSSDSSIVYRLTWLRTFDNPIVVGIKETKNKYILYWKVGKGAGGYKPKGLKKKGKKEMSMNQWNYFNSLLDSLKFDSLPNESDFPIEDGHTFTLEKKKGSYFKAHSTNYPSKQFEEICLYLLELTGLNYGKEETNSYLDNRIFLTKRGSLISEQVLTDSILGSLNKYLDREIHQTFCCCYYDFILKFSKSGQIRKVKLEPDENWFYDRWANFVERSCRKEFKKALKNISFSEYGISSRFNVHAYFKVNKVDYSLEYYE